jgi:sugar-specific transcriptional regulator TrmB
MITENQLIKIGLSSKRARIYLALLEHGPLIVQDIADKTKIKRTTLYPIIEKMIEDDMLGIEVRQKRKRYFAKDPESLVMRLREQRNFLEALMPQLQDLYSKQTGGTRIQVYDNVAGLKKTMEEILSLKKSEEILVINADINEALRIGFDFWKDLLAKKKKLQIPSRTIVPSDEVSDFILSDHNIQLRTNDKLKNFKMMVHLFSNKSLIIIPRQPLAILIENKIIKDGLTDWFEIIWKRSKPYGPK